MVLCFCVRLPLLLAAAASTAAGQQRFEGSVPHLLDQWQPALVEGTTTLSDRVRKVRIASSEQWQQKRHDIERRVLDIMGELPAGGAPLSPKLEGEQDLGSYRRVKVSYAAASGERIPAWLLVPKRRGPFPAILALHPTNPVGKDSVVGLGDRPSQHYGKELAENGFVVLAPDCITAGERVSPGGQPYVTEPFDRESPRLSAMGKMLADHRRGIDMLLTLPYVDAGRIGAIGHSLGGYNAFFLAAFDSRIRAAAASCGFTPLGGATRPFAWARESWFVHFPRLKPYLRSGILPFDMQEVMALAAPRWLFTYSAEQDRIFPDPEAIRKAAGEVAEVYGLLGAPEAFRFEMGTGPHEFPEAMRQEAYRWFRRALGGKTEHDPSALVPK